MEIGDLSNVNLEVNQTRIQQQEEKQLDNLSHSVINEDNADEERLKEVVNEFTSIFLQQVFSEMRDTVPEGDLIDGGFAEEVFTEMLDEEISKMGATQDTFSNLNEVMFRQLNRNL